MRIPQLALVLLLVLALAACDTTAERQSSIGTPPAASPTALATHAPTAPPAAARTATPAPPPPTASPHPTAAASPTATPAPTAARTATARPAPAATPKRALPTQPAQSAYHYVFPVRSDGKISYGKFHHDYPATDIFCPIGSAFLAVTDGIVDYVSSADVWDPAVNDGATRGGLSVAIIGDDGVRYYGSHLSQIADGIAPGVRVRIGQMLGLTGKSGDARNTDAHLHFGISHPTTPEDWAVRRGELSPYATLRAWQRGEDVTPVLK
jgi:murein DD-endopeptidase MepM/ murein hydrolase activator NlpD